MKHINLFEPDISSEEKNAINEVLDEGWITQGPRVETENCLKSDRTKAVAVSSCCSSHIRT